MTSIAPGPLDPSPLAGKRALVVDRSTSSCELLCAILEDSGMRVQSVCCWSGLPEAARVLVPDVVLLDVTDFSSGSRAMIDGFRALPGCEATPMIALAPTSLYPEPHTMAQAGFAAVLPKPISPQRLRAAVQQQLTGRL